MPRTYEDYKSDKYYTEYLVVNATSVFLGQKGILVSLDSTSGDNKYQLAFKTKDGKTKLSWFGGMDLQWINPDIRMKEEAFKKDVLDLIAYLQKEKGYELHYNYQGEYCDSVYDLEQSIEEFIKTRGLREPA